MRDATVRPMSVHVTSFLSSLYVAIAASIESESAGNSFATIARASAGETPLATTADATLLGIARITGRRMTPNNVVDVPLSLAALCTSASHDIMKRITAS